MKKNNISRVETKALRIPNMQIDGAQKVSEFNSRMLREISEQPEIREVRDRPILSGQPGMRRVKVDQKSQLRMELPTIHNISSLWTIGGIAIGLTVLRAWVFNKHYTQEYTEKNIFAKDPLKWLDLMIAVSLAIPIINSV